MNLFRALSVKNPRLETCPFTWHIFSMRLPAVSAPLLAALFIGLSALSCQGAVTLLEDNFVWRGGPDAVQTNGTSLTGKGPAPSQGNARTIYLKFDMSAATIADGIYANLALATTGTASANFTLSLFALNEGAAGFNWSETAITWNNSPGLGTGLYELDASKTTYLGDFTPLSTGNPSGTVISTYFSNWQDYVQSDGTLTLIAVVSAQSDAGPSIGFHSSESGSTALRPELTLNNVPEPGRIMLLAIGAAGLFMRRRRAGV